MLFDVLEFFKYIHHEVIMNFLRNLPLDNDFHNQNTFNQEIVFTEIPLKPRKNKMILRELNQSKKIIFEK